MTNRKKEVTKLELRELLHELNDKRPDICIRIRLVGEMWQQNFMRIHSINSGGLLLLDETITKFIEISNLQSIIQFEIDRGFKAFEPHFHYDVVLLGSVH